MPVPSPKPEEDQQTFVGRCISDMHDLDPERPQDQIIAMCYNAWRSAKGESFGWIPTDRFYLPENASGRLYKVYAIHAGETQHFDLDGIEFTRVFSRDELLRLAGGMVNQLVNLDHLWFEQYEGTNKVVDAEVEDDCLECIIYVEDSTINKFFDEGHIIGASIEYFIRDEKNVDGLAQIGCVAAGLALVTDRFGKWGKPADTRTKVLAFDSKTEVKLIPSHQIKRCIKMAEQQQQQHECPEGQRWDEQAQKCVWEAEAYKAEIETKIKKHETRFYKLLMTLSVTNKEAATILDEIQKEQWADLPDSDFACIIGEGDNRQRKLPIHDCDHVQNAMARFNQTEGCQTDKDKVKAKICARARDPCKMDAAFEEGGFCHKGETKTETRQCGLVGTSTLWDRLTPEQRKCIEEVWAKRDKEAERWRSKLKVT